MSDFQGILLDEADGVNRTQEPVMPAGFQPPKIVVSSWNRKVTLAFFSPTQGVDSIFISSMKTSSVFLLFVIYIVFISSSGFRLWWPF